MFYEDLLATKCKTDWRVVEGREWLMIEAIFYMSVSDA